MEQHGGTVEECGGTVEQCGIAWHGTVGQYGKIVKQYCGTGEQCETIMVGEWNSVAVWHSVVEQCGRVWCNSGTVW